MRKRIEGKEAEKYRDDVYRLYIVENMSYENGAEQIGLPSHVFRRLCNRFGFVKSKDAIDKARIKTNLEKYGCDNPFGNDNIKKKIVESNIEKYGTPYAIMNPDVKKKAVQATFEHYGKTNPTYINISDDSVELLGNCKDPVGFIEKNGIKNASDLAVCMGVSITTAYRWANRYGVLHMLDCYTSKYESEIKKLLSSWGIEAHKDKRTIAPYEIDLFCPDYNIGIEFNGNLYHSFVGDMAPHCDGKEKKYHYEKTVMASKKGVFLFHIFEYEWNDARKKECIISQLRNLFSKNERKIYARSCEVRTVDAKTKDDFLQANHKQGADRSNTNLGLFYNGELVSIMTFSKPRFSKKYNWELSRFCSVKNTSVVGGASKLFAYFVKDHCGSIVSYSDISKTSGDVYLRMGFVLSHISDPNYVWCNSSNQVIPRYRCQMKDEVKTMRERGFWRIFDCGNRVWVYKN